MMRWMAWLGLVALVVGCGSDETAQGAACSSGCHGFWGHLVILAATVGIGYVLSNKAESNGDLLRSIFSDVKRLSRKVEELEEKLQATEGTKKPAAKGKDKDKGE